MVISIASTKSGEVQSKWVPSTFDHSKYFQLGKHHNATCTTCHTNADFTHYACYGCHEHNESSIINEHNEHRVGNLNKCASCHRGGGEHEGSGDGKRRGESHRGEDD